MLEPISINWDSLNISIITPMIITLVGAILILTFDFFTKLSKVFYTFFSIAVTVLSFVSLLAIQPGSGFFGLVVVDGFSILGQLIILAASMLFLPLSLTSHRFNEFEYPEFFALFLSIILGFQFMISSNNLILIFIGLELASLGLYTIICMHNRDRSTEAAIKYFTMGSFAAGLFAFGSMFFYLATGHVDIAMGIKSITANNFQNFSYLILGLAFLLASMAFKLSMVPFHTWTPDVYEGASAPLAGYMSIVPKIAGFIVAIRLFEHLVQIEIYWLRDMLWIISVLTMTLGNVMALVQESVKRMLAFSSISHAGFGMVAILVATPESNAALFLYWALFMFANLGAFTMLWISRHKSKIFHNRFDHPYTKFTGMAYTSPIAAVIMGIFMLSLAGIPPFAVFWGKFYLVSATVAKGYILLALIMLLNSAIAVYYYLKLIVYMFLREPSFTDRTIYIQNITNPFKFIVAVSALATIFSIFGIDFLFSIINTYLQSVHF